MRLLAVWTALAVHVAAAAPVGRVVGTVTITDPDGKPVDAEAIIYVVGFKESPAPNAQPTQIAQKNRAFVPDLVAITVGETVAFPNRDPFLHNVFSESPARKFDLGSFKKDEQKTKDFTEPGVVDVYCNIHPEMAATILVLPNRAHTRRNHDGSYTIAGVPPGTWTVFAYTRRMTKPVSAPVTVIAGQDARVDLALARGAESPHLNKYGEQYHDTGTSTYR
ncbi:MAG TPA: carboxypeptidase regulatory-like domain-containing protein [Kofleriaceae bacterium]